MESPKTSESRHPIRVVAARTGLTPSALRAWERRYGVVEPARSEGGQRLYTDGDVERLSLLKRITDAGRSIGDVAHLSLEEIRRLATEDEEARRAVRAGAGAGSPGGTAAAREAAAARVEACMAAIEALDAEALEAGLRRAGAALGAVPFMDDVVAPLLRRVGEEWAADTLRPAQEHVASAVIRRVLHWLADPGGGGDGPGIVVGTLPGERHELGAMLASATASVEGWRVVYLGPDLPVDEIATAAENVGARAIALSVASPSPDSEPWDLLGSLRQRVAPEVAIVVGGGGAGAAVEDAGSPGLEVLTSLRDFQRTLRRLAPEPAVPPR